MISRMARRGFLAVAAGIVGAVIVGLALTVHPVRAGKSEIYTGLLSRTAIGGYDAVAYFTENRAVRGKRSHVHRWHGAEWRFSSRENRDIFATDPESYAPQYGGHCAWAVSQGYRAKGDPKVWRIVDGKLYLNCSHVVQQRWQRRLERNLVKADNNWPGILD